MSIPSAMPTMKSSRPASSELRYLRTDSLGAQFINVHRTIELLAHIWVQFLEISVTDGRYPEGEAVWLILLHLLGELDGVGRNLKIG